MIFEFFKKLFWKADEGNKKRKASEVIFSSSENNVHFKKRCQDFASSNHIKIISGITEKSSDINIENANNQLSNLDQLRKKKELNNSHRSESIGTSMQNAVSKVQEFNKTQISNKRKVLLKPCEISKNSFILYKNCETLEYKQYSEILASHISSTSLDTEDSFKSQSKKNNDLLMTISPCSTQENLFVHPSLNISSRNLLINKKKEEINSIQNPCEVQHKPHTQVNTLRNHLSSKQVIQDKYIDYVAHKYDTISNERIQEIQELKKITCILSKHNRLIREAALEKYLNDSMHLCQAVLDEKDSYQDFKPPELTVETIKYVEQALSIGLPDEILIEKFGLQIKRRDIQTLAGLNWLNDEVINFYMNLLMVRSNIEKYPTVYAMNTFFYPKLVSSGHSSLKRWTRKVDIFTKDLIVIPIHLGIHWCMSIVDFRQKSIRYYDSMGSPNSKCLQILKQYLNDECIDKKKKPFEFRNWNFECMRDIPQQMNGSDCGVFSCMFAEYICANKKLNFTQDDMPYFRTKMAYEILTSQLL